MDSKYLIALNVHPKIGSQTIKKVLAVFENDSEKLWKSDKKLLVERLGERMANLISEARSSFDPDIEIEKLQKMGIGYITSYDKYYPKLLNEVYDCPAILYFKGNTELLNENSLAIVGSRRYSDYGKSVAKHFTNRIVEMGLAVVSGLALGIDSIVHRETLDSKGKTIGVLGCGLDKIYPSSNAQLGRETIEQGGLLLSEFPIGTPPFKQNFPLRNRIIAGLSLGTLVIEAKERSGALITAYEALEYNREVFAVPGDINRETSVGTNLLIKQGAIPALSPEVIFETLNIKKDNCEKTVIKDKFKYETLSQEEQTILDIISNETRIDKIKQLSGYNIVLINSTLTMLEIKGLIENVGGGKFKKMLS